MRRNVGVWFLLCLVLVALYGCSLGEIGSGAPVPACMPLGTVGGYVPDFAADGNDGFAKYRDWLAVNQPCVPAQWLPHGCALTAANEKTTVFAQGRLPYNYDGGLYYPDSGMAQLSSDIGVQVLVCGSGYRVLYWSLQQGKDPPQTTLYHELSSPVTNWTPWSDAGSRYGTVPVGVHDPQFPKAQAEIDEWLLADGTIQLSEVGVS